jgi:hypothetical protein
MIIATLRDNSNSGDKFSSDDDGITMPMYKDRYDAEVNTGTCTKEWCAHRHQKQIDKFPAEDIEALYPTRKAARQAELQARKDKKQVESQG